MAAGKSGLETVGLDVFPHPFVSLGIKESASLTAHTQYEPQNNQTELEYSMEIPEHQNNEGITVVNFSSGLQRTCLREDF